MKQTVRIIGGLYRGKKIPFLDSNGLRPTPDRVRETVFNWLMHDIRQARCLDAFAGSGAMGFEALSRGASAVTLIEKSPAVATHLNRIITELKQPQIKVIHTDALEYIRNTKDTFDIIFLDPPFQSNLLTNCLNQLGQSTVLREQGLVYVESASEIDAPQSTWKRLKHQKAGQVYYGLLRRIG